MFITVGRVSASPRLLITVCSACHARLHRLASIHVCIPEILAVLWAEQHPANASAAAVCLRGKGLSEAVAVVQARNAGRPTWEQIKALVLDSVTSPHSKRAYSRAINEFVRWAGEQQTAGQGSPFGKALVQRYRAVLEEKGLASSSINVRLAALRKLALEAADNGLLDPDVASAVGRVKGVVQKGRRIGRWLTREEASALLRDSGDDGLKAKRDRALFCLLLGAGLRREEIVSLEIGHILQREGRWVIADLIGKRKRIRTVPIPGWAKVAIDQWTAAGGITEGSCFGRSTRPAA